MMGVCMPRAKVGPNHRELVSCLHGVNAAFGSAHAHCTSWVCQSQEQIPPQVCVPQGGGRVTEGTIPGVVTVGEPAAPGRKGLRRWKELQLPPG